MAAGCRTCQSFRDILVCPYPAAETRRCRICCDLPIRTPGSRLSPEAFSDESPVIFTDAALRHLCLRRRSDAAKQAGLLTPGSTGVRLLPRAYSRSKFGASSSGSCRTRTRLQRRARDGLSPSSLFGLSVQSERQPARVYSIVPKSIALQRQAVKRLFHFFRNTSARPPGPRRRGCCEAADIQTLAKTARACGVLPGVELGLSTQGRG